MEKIWLETSQLQFIQAKTTWVSGNETYNELYLTIAVAIHVRKCNSELLNFYIVGSSQTTLHMASKSNMREANVLGMGAFSSDLRYQKVLYN